MSEPITRSEMYLAALGGEAVTPPAPITRMDMYLAYLNGMTDTYPEPITRTEQYLYKLCQNGMGGGGVTIRNQNKTITENGTYRHDTGYTGLGPVTVNVPQEDPVVEPLEVTENGTYNPREGVDGFAPVTVNVAASGGGGDALLLSILDRSVEVFNSEKITELGYRALNRATALTSVSLPNLESIGLECFVETGITEVDFPKAKSVATRAFQNCKSLVRVNLPLANPTTATAPGVFSGCTSLKEVNIPSYYKIQGAVFQNCTSLEKIHIPGAYDVQGGAFQGCSVLKVVALGWNKGNLVSLSNVNAFTSTPFASGGTGGVVLMPSEKITAYTTATNWSTIYAYGTNRFLALEDYTVDGTVTGEIDWDKVNALFE